MGKHRTKFEGNARQLSGSLLDMTPTKGPIRSLKGGSGTALPLSDGNFRGERRPLAAGPTQLSQQPPMTEYVIVFKGIREGGEEVVLEIPVELPQDTKPTGLDVWPANTYRAK